MKSAANDQQWGQIFNLFARARFARLCSYLRQREPDDEVGYSIMIYRLSDGDLARALDGPPAEMADLPNATR